jgi:hypothetical protein
VIGVSGHRVIGRPTHVAEFNGAQRDAGDNPRLFRDLVGFVLIALSLYTRQVARLREFVETAGFREALKAWAERSQ